MMTSLAIMIVLEVVSLGFKLDEPVCDPLLQVVAERVLLILLLRVHTRDGLTSTDLKTERKTLSFFMLTRTTPK